MRPYVFAEWKKTRKLQLFMIGMAFLVFSSFIGLGVYFANRAVLIDKTQSLVLWGQLTFYNSTLLYPPMLAIIVGQLLMPEFERKNIEMLKANQVSMDKLYFGKLLSGFFLILSVQLFLLLIFVVAAKVDGISFDLSLAVHIKWLLLSVVASFPIMTLQSFVTAKTRNFSKVVGVATKFFPYSQPMIALRSRSLTDMSLIDLTIFLVVNSLYSLLFYKLTVAALKKNE